MQFLIQFLKKHYEKIILCLVLLGLGAAIVWMGSAIRQVKAAAAPGVASKKVSPVVPLDLTTNLSALAAMTNPPPVELSGGHNLFNPVTWRKKPSGDLIKILKTGPNALTVTNITPLYTIISYDRPSGSGEVYVMTVQQHSGKKTVYYSKKDEKKKTVPYVVTGVRGGTAEDPAELNLEITDTQESVWVSKENPYKRVDSYIVDLRYEPELRTLSKLKLNDSFNLDGEPYKLVEITNNLIRVQSINNSQYTKIPWNPAP